MPDRMPEDLPVTKRIDVMVGITRSKVFGPRISSRTVFEFLGRNFGLCWGQVGPACGVESNLNRSLLGWGWIGLHFGSMLRPPWGCLLGQFGGQIVSSESECCYNIVLVSLSLGHLYLLFLPAGRKPSYTKSNTQQILTLLTHAWQCPWSVVSVIAFQFLALLNCSPSQT